jgi:hypothetical protein
LNKNTKIWTKKLKKEKEKEKEKKKRKEKKDRKKKKKIRWPTWARPKFAWVHGGCAARPDPRRPRATNRNSGERNSRRKNINRPSPQTGTASPFDIEHHTDEVSWRGSAAPGGFLHLSLLALPPFRFNQHE